MDAAARHSDYAEARHVERRLERLATRNGVLDQLDDTRSEGIGIRVRVGGAWGFACSRGHDRAGAEAALRARRGPGPLATRLGGRRAGPRAAGAGLVGEPRGARPVRRAAGGQAVAAGGGGRRAARRHRREPDARELRGARTRTTFVSSEGAACEQTRDRVRRRHRAAVVRSAATARCAPSRGSHGGPSPRPATSTSSASTWPGARRGWRAEAPALLRRTGLPGRAHDADPGRASSSGCRSTSRSATPWSSTACSAREASYAGTSFVRAGRRRVAALSAPRMMSVHRRRHHARARSAAIAGTTRAWRARRVPIVREGVLRGFLSSRETRGRDRARALRRLHARRGLRPPADRADDEREPRAGRRRDARGPDRRHRARDPDRHEPLVVDRLPPPPLPVRGRGGVGDPRTASCGRLLRDPVLRGRDARASGAAATPSARPEAWRLASVIDCGKGEPGQMARVSHGCRAGALPRRGGGRWRERPPSWPSGPLRGRRRRDALAMRDPRALAAAALRRSPAHPGHLGRRRHRGARRAARRPRRPRVHQRHRPRRLAGCAAPRGGRARGRPRRPRPAAGAFPGFPAARARAAPRRPRPRHRRAGRRSREARRWPHAFAVAAAAGRGGPRDLDGRRGASGRVGSPASTVARPGHRRVHEGRLHRAGRAQRLRRRRRAWPSAARRPRAWPARGRRQGRGRRASPRALAARRATRW